MRNLTNKMGRVTGFEPATLGTTSLVFITKLLQKIAVIRHLSSGNIKNLNTFNKQNSAHKLLQSFGKLNTPTSLYSATGQAQCTKQTSHEVGGQFIGYMVYSPNKQIKRGNHG